MQGDQTSRFPRFGPQFGHFDFSLILRPQHSRQELGKSVLGAIPLIKAVYIRIQLGTSLQHGLPTNSFRLKVVQE